MVVSIIIYLILLGVQEAVAPTYYVKWGDCLLDTGYNNNQGLKYYNHGVISNLTFDVVVTIRAMPTYLMILLQSWWCCLNSNLLIHSGCYLKKLISLMLFSNQGRVLVAIYFMI